MNKIVSIVTPCFNGEKYLDGYFQSILNQTYNYIEIILIDDGSTDNTVGKINFWKPKIVERGYSLKYIYQENGGPAKAVNTGLKHIDGEYLLWPDCDDLIYPNNSIEKRVSFFECNQNYGVVRGKAEYVHEDTPNEIIYVIGPSYLETNSLFLDMIFERTYITPGTFMVRTSFFKEANPKMIIYDTNRAGQNWQLLLPLVFKNKVGFIDEIVHKYFYHPKSLSHNINSKDKYNWSVNHYSKHKEILFETIKTMDIEEKDKLLNSIANKYKKYNYKFAIKYNAISDIKLNYELLPLECKNVFETILIFLSLLIRNTILLKSFYFIKKKVKLGLHVIKKLLTYLTFSKQ